MHRPNPQTCEIRVAVGYPMTGKVMDEYEIDAVCVSPLYAVNRQMQRDEDGEIDYATRSWNVTHLPTEYAVIANLPTKGVAVAFAERLVELGFGSESTDPLVASSEMARQGVAEFKAWTLAQVQQKVVAAPLEEGIRSWPDVAQGRPAKKKKSTKRKPPKKASKKVPKKKKGKKKKRAKKEKEEPDLLTLARQIPDSNPPAPLSGELADAKAQCLW